MLAYFVCIALVVIAALPALAQEPAGADSPAGDPANAAAEEQLEMGGPPPSVNWKRLFWQSGMFLGVQHAFRLGTEPGTREGLKGKFWPEYGQAVGNMHGWSDGDPFFVNYIGHPMQGAVSGFIWTQNDRRFYPVRFGRDRAYWESRMRAAAFAYIYSTQFELGPLSEASIGKIQRYYPQQGFVDHVITPTIGVAWMLGEDAIDQYIVVPLEKRFENIVARALLRGGLNPARTFANLMRFKKPWYRDDRPNVGDPRVSTFQPRKVHREIPPDHPGVAPVDFEMTAHTQYFPGSGGAWCLGGGGTGNLRLTPSTQAVLELAGCNLMSLGKHQSGDFLTFLAGAKWTGSGSNRWKPHAQFLMGVAKATIETEDPVLKAAAQAHPPKPASNSPAYPEYLTLKEDSGFSLSAGAGVDYRLNRALQFRIARFAYRYSGLNPLFGYDLSHSLEFTAGLTLRMGTW
jgi:hypothetical protein